MKIDDLVALLATFPIDSEVFVQLGDEVLEISDLLMRGGTNRVGIRSRPADLRDVMNSWGVAPFVSAQVAVDDPRRQDRLSQELTIEGS
jgi:hypothetical protein